MNKLDLYLHDTSFDIYDGHIRAKDGDKQFDKNKGFIGNTKSGLIADVIRMFSKTDYFFLVGEILKGRGAGDNDAHISFNRATSEWEFYFDYNDEVAKNVSRISYADGIKLFHTFFNAFKEHVEKENPEFMQTKVPSLTVDVEVWPRFLEQIDRLNQHYAGLVAKGEIKE